MRKFLILFFASAFLGQPLVAVAAHLCMDDGAMHLCEDVCPSEGQAEEGRHAEDETHQCCAAASFAVVASLAVELRIPLKSAGIQVEKVSHYLNPARDVFHPPA